MAANFSLAGLADAFRQDLRYALRGIRSRPAFAFLVTLTIALGLGADATMFGIVDRLLFRAPEHVRDPDRVVLVQTHSAGSRFTDNSFSYPTFTGIRQGVPAFVDVAASSPGTFPLGRGAEATSVDGALVSANFFDVLGARPALGRFFAADEGQVDRPQNVAVIGHGFWSRRFGKRRDAIGSTLAIGTQRYTIVGVAPRGFTGLELSDVDVWLPLAAAGGLRFDKTPGWATNRGSQYLSLVARLREGVNPRVAAEQATAVYRGDLRQRVAETPRLAAFIKPDSERVVLASLVPGKGPDAYSASVSGDSLKVARLLAVVSLLVLVIACANVANLLLGRALERQREIAVRRALGVSHRRLVGQLLVEALLLSSLGAVGALLVVHWTSRAVGTLLLRAGAWTTEALDARMLAFTAVATLATAVITSIAPALQARRTDIAGALKAGAREGGGQRARLRSALIVVQAALAVVLLAGAGLFVRSVRNINALPFGIDVRHVLVGHVTHTSVGLSTADATRLYHDFADQVRRVPGVKYSAVSLGLPFGMSWSLRVFVPGRTLPDVGQQPVQYAVTPDYFNAMGIRLLDGRALSATDLAGTPKVAVINETMARLYWPNRHAVGECAKLEADTMPCTTIVGVVSNTVRQRLREGLVPQLYRPLDQLPLATVDHAVSFFGYDLVVSTSGEAARYAESVRRAMQSVSSTVPYADVKPMTALLGRRTRAWELGARVFSAFGALALILAAVGLYSVLAFSIAQRVREFGVRMALGARPSDILRLTTSAGLLPVVGGMAAGLVLALLASPLVGPLLFDVSARDPGVLGGVCGILFAASVVASVVPAWRATRVDPAAALRAD